MRALVASFAVIALVGTAGAGSPLVGELRSVATRYHESPQKLGEVTTALEKAADEVDPRSTNMRVGLARTLLKKGRAVDARRELETVLGEASPSNPADWTMKDVPQATALLAGMKERS